MAEPASDCFGAQVTRARPDGEQVGEGGDKHKGRLPKEPAIRSRRRTGRCDVLGRAKRSALTKRGPDRRADGEEAGGRGNGERGVYGNVAAVPGRRGRRVSREGRHDALLDL